MDKVIKWPRRIGSYSNEELVVLSFRSIKGINKAIDLIWSDPDFKNLPQESPDGKSLIVPKEAVPLFRKRKLKFKLSKLPKRRK